MKHKDKFETFFYILAPIIIVGSIILAIVIIKSDLPFWAKFVLLR